MKKHYELPIGGREVTYPDSFTENEDPYRGQRRRPWLVFRIGTNTAEVTKNNFISYVEKVRTSLIKSGILLDDESEVLFYNPEIELSNDGVAELESLLRNALCECDKNYIPGPLSTPIGIYVLDSRSADCCKLDVVIDDFSSDINFFKIDITELLDQTHCSDYRALTMWCDEFAKHLAETEGLPQSIAIKLQVEKNKEFGVNPVNFNCNRTGNIRGNVKGSSFWRKNQRNSGKIDAIKMPTYRGNKQLSMDPPPGLSNRDSSNFHTPPGLKLREPPGLEKENVNKMKKAECDFAESDEEDFGDRRVSLDALIGIDAVHSALDYIIDSRPEFKRGELVTHNSTFVELISAEKLYNRFSEPFVTVEHNLDLLFVLNHAVSSENSAIRRTVNRVFEEIIQRKFTMSLVDKFMKPRILDRRWTLYYAEIVFEIAHLFGYMCRSYPYIDRRVLQNWTFYWDQLVQIDIEDIIRASVTEREASMLNDLTKRINVHINEECRTMESGSVYYKDEYNSHREKYSNRDYDNYDRNSYRREERSQSRPDRERYSFDEVDNSTSMRRRGYEEREYLPYHQNGSSSELHEDRMRYRQYPPDDRHGSNGQCDFSDSDSDRSYENRSRRHVMDTYKDQTEEEIEVYGDPDEFSKEEHAYKYCDPSFYVDNDIPLWQICEKKEPPQDFRLLPAIPTLSDYYRPVEPYVRRIQESGIYKSVDHYLDVQFRLFREDLVSPLRDGVDIYKKNGTCRGKMISGVISSDLKIYYLDRIEAKQVSLNGLDMRIAYFAGRSMEELFTDGEMIKGSSLVLLSCDGFENDMHLAMVLGTIADRGQISLAMLEEMKESPIRGNKSYIMAEANSYLPSYRFVLKNLQHINRFVPIPFERYIVHGKKIISRPAYQRQPKQDEQLADEKKMEQYYKEIRTEAHARRVASGKELTVRGQPAKLSKKNSLDDKEFEFNNPFEYFSAGDKDEDVDEEDADEEGKHLREPIFSKPASFLTEKEGDRIRIDGEWYQISTLLNNYHPDYMDESQRIAFCNTFLREISLIQGPPGTGKTHIGVEIVKTMLVNKVYWGITEPIMILSYTNKAIDQFLEKIWDMINECEGEIKIAENKPKVIRYGSNCTSESLKNHTIREVVNREFRQFVQPKVQSRYNSAHAEKSRKERELAAASYALYSTKHNLISFNYISRVMDPKYRDELGQWTVTHTDSKDNALSEDEAFACWLLDREFGKLDNHAISKQRAKVSKMRIEADVVIDEEEDYDSDIADEELLDMIFKKINLNCAGKDILDDINTSTDIDLEFEYYTKEPWIIVGSTPTRVILLGEEEKMVSNKRIRIDEVLKQSLEEEKAMILDTLPLNKEELDDITYIFSLQRPKRWALYQYWCSCLRRMLVETIPGYIKEFREASEKVMKETDIFDSEIAKGALVLGATTSGSARLRRMIEFVKPKILIMEEAAEIAEPHVLSSFYPSIEHVVMIGDHQQLRPSTSVHELGISYGLNISMFERLVERGLPYSQLKEQHRMNTNITETLVKPWFYPNVHDAEIVRSYPPVKGMEHNLYLWSHTGREETINGTSWMNMTEIDMIVPLVKHLLRQTYKPTDITVITTYSAQREAILYRFSREFSFSTDVPEIAVETVDSYQGCENKIVIVSLVRSHRGKDQNTGIGFLSVKNRICVALTRAQHGMYMIGNAVYLSNNSTLWNNIIFKSMDHKKFVDYCLYLKCQTHGNVIVIDEPEDFEKKSPEGGCCEICNMMKECGHRCLKFCHPDFENDHLHPCYSSCLKKCPNLKYNHPCSKKCYESCGNCMEYVELKLQCGHKITTACYRADSALCDQPCSKFIICGHECANKCGEECTKVEDCMKIIPMKLSCGHIRKITCSELNSSKAVECVERCERLVLGCEHQCAERCGAPCTSECQVDINVKLKCGHPIKVKCFEVDIEDEIEDGQFECKELVPKKMEGCGHVCKIGCDADPISELCTEVCREKLSKCGHECGDKCGKCFKTKQHHCQASCGNVLSCGHKCTSKCGDECPSCTTFCLTSCSHMKCGMGDTGYGRVCGEMCVMCTKGCDNKCIHRSCTKLCLEECDVQPCNEPCRLALDCKHACLGMCGEICPRVCGTCNRSKYNEYISMMAGTEQKFHRLIEIPACGHVFPVKYLEDHIQKQKKNKELLRCPNSNCGKFLNGIHRFAKYMKSCTNTRNIEKMKRKMKDKDAAKLLCDSFDIRNKSIMIINGRKNNCTKGMQDDFRIIQSVLLKLGNGMNSIGQDERYLAIYYLDLMRCVHAICILMMKAVTLRQWARKDKRTPQIDILILDVFGMRDLPMLQWREIVSAVTDVQNFWELRMPGAILPKLRFKLARILVSLQILMLNRILFEAKSDLSEKSAKSLRNLYVDFYKKNEKMDILSSTAIIEKQISSDVAILRSENDFMGWKSLDVPDF